MLLPKFFHKVNGSYYFNYYCPTMKEYKDQVREAYGSLVGVKCFELGVDYDSVTWIGDHCYPVKDHKYVGI